VPLFDGGFVWSGSWELSSPSDKQKGGFVIQHVTVNFWTLDPKGVLVKNAADDGNWDYWEAWRVNPDRKLLVGSARATDIDTVFRQPLLAYNGDANNSKKDRATAINTAEKLFPLWKKSADFGPRLNDTFAIAPPNWNITGLGPKGQQVPKGPGASPNTEGTISFQCTAWYIDKLQNLPNPPFVKGGANHSGVLLSFLSNTPGGAGVVAGLLGGWASLPIKHNIIVKWDSITPPNDLASRRTVIVSTTP
jgi:hypothetical protein